MDSEKKARGKIESLQALRAVAFLGIFLGHAGAAVYWPSHGVSVFFVLSGFLLYQRHSDEDLDCGIKESMRFALERVKKLYPLHLVTMVLAFLLLSYAKLRSGFHLRRVIVLLGELALNVPLLQTWFPYHNVNTSMNGVAWYLSVNAFLLFIFPRVRRFVKGKTPKTLWVGCVLILLLQWFSCIPFYHFLGRQHQVSLWFSYCFPIFRAGDFFVGCILGKSYEAFSAKGKPQPSFLKASLLEILATILVVLIAEWFKTKPGSVVIVALRNPTTVYVVIAAAWVWLFATKGGVITKALTNRFLIFLGDLSPYMFLIHFVITNYTAYAIYLLRAELTVPAHCIVILLEFAMTVLLSMLWMKLVVRRKRTSCMAGD